MNWVGMRAQEVLKQYMESNLYALTLFAMNSINNCASHFILFALRRVLL